ncbi:dihydrolipoamide acetyltransferase family protein [Sedimentitalea sp. JM2-8]|uniref:Dihydrolipoamide acetyltransferase component of pyruvate dehydrogenase complex n=1 Tax=Sedimentitalea xiamensis TaxID=3050037 RepID=A0ABT7FLE1_9RHOB|nr:dihydrolipoamide acetyltransferase family protein [Sedimentitalea xiamensis]
MIVAVKLPDVGEGVTEAELAEWNVAAGDIVKEDDVIAAVMTDKATVEIPSLYSGKVVRLGGSVGEVLAVGSDLVLIETDAGAGSSGNTPSPEAPAATASKVDAAKPAVQPVARPSPARASAVPANGAPRAEGQPPLASPSVRARAREAGLDLRQIAGSGPAGRITHADIDAVFDMPRRSPGQAAPPGRAARTGTEEIKVIGMRRKIAERMALANARIPHITVVEEVDVTALEELREKLNAGRGDKPKLTVLPFVTATLAKAVLDHPEMNAHYLDDDGIILRHAAVNAGIATMTDAGLVVPVLRNAEALDLFQTAAEITRLSEAARTGKAKRDELTGSTFTITSLGPLGALATTPIINHPEVAILGINKMATRPMWDGTQFVPRKMMNISASFDHRVIDGWDAAVFVQRIKSLLETPALIFMET